jgi:hypothetical protein
MFDPISSGTITFTGEISVCKNKRKALKITDSERIFHFYMRR